MPYSLGAYANALSIQYNLTSQETAQFLIDVIPTKTLPVISREIYSQAAALGGASDSPEYYGALESMFWADSIEVTHRKYLSVTGVAGAAIGGAAGTAVQAAHRHNARNRTVAEKAVPAEAIDGFLETTSAISLMVAPILAAGVVGAWLAKKCSPGAMKFVARGVVRRAKASQEGPVVSVTQDVIVPQLPEETGRIARLRTPDGHPEVVEDAQLYRIARKRANHQGCYDENKYADFLTAEMPSGELNMLIYQTKVRLAKIVADSNSPSRQDPRYSNLLRDLQISKAITNHRIEVGGTLKKVGRVVGYLGLLSFLGFQISNLAENVDLVEPMSYAETFSASAQVALLSALAGRLGVSAFATRTDFFVQRRSKRVVDQALKETDLNTGEE